MKTVWLGLAVVLLGLASTAAPAGTVAVITHPDRANVPIDRQWLLAVFTMRVRTWPDGTPARVFVLPDRDTLHGQFCQEQLGAYPYVLRAIWDRMVFTGTGLAPETARSEEDMKARVRTTPGAIGYARNTLQSPTPAKSQGETRMKQGDR